MTLQNVKSRGTADHQAKRAAYQPGTLADWGDDVPVDVADALDKLRARRHEHHVVFFALAIGVVYDESGIMGPASAVDTLTTDTTLTTAHNIVLVDTSAGPITLTLPDAATYAGPGYTIKNIAASANAVTIDGTGPQTIDETPTRILAMQYDAVEVMSDGTEWWLHVK